MRVLLVVFVLLAYWLHLIHMNVISRRVMNSWSKNIPLPLLTNFSWQITIDLFSCCMWYGGLGIQIFTSFILIIYLPPTELVFSNCRRHTQCNTKHTFSVKTKVWKKNHIHHYTIYIMWKLSYIITNDNRETATAVCYKRE